MPSSRALVLRLLPRVILLGFGLLSQAALAGRTSHLLVEESQIVPEGDVELEQWLWGVDRIPAFPSRPLSEWMWWGPVVGLSPHWELAAPMEWVGNSDSVAFATLGLDVRYRIFPRENDEGFQPLVRLSYVHPLSEYVGPARVELNAVLSDGPLNGVRVNVNAGARCSLPFLADNSRPVSVTLTAALGASIPIRDQLRIGAEVEGEWPILNATTPGFRGYVGPSLAWSKGPFWITLGALTGLSPGSASFYPKVLWAVML